MPNDKSAKKPSWKQAGSGSNPAAGPQYNWRTGNRPEAPQPGLSRRTKGLLIAGSLLLSTAVGVVVLIWLLRPQPPSGLVLAGTSYVKNLAIPPNPYGWLGLEKLSAGMDQSARLGQFTPRFPRLPDKTPLALDLSPGKSKEVLLDQLKKRVGEFSGKIGTVIVVLALHGGVDKDGKCYFLLGSDSPQEPEHRLQLDELLHVFDDAPDKKKLLVLDAGVAAPRATIGLLRTDFVDRLRTELTQHQGVRDLAVICSCDTGQRSWTSDVWGQTAFMHYLTEGLNGAVAIDLGGDNAITAQALFTYVHAHVATWALGVHDRLQEPVLLSPEGDDAARSLAAGMVLARTAPTSSSESSAVTPPDTGDRSKPLADLESAWSDYWQFLDPKTAGLSPAVYNPHLWHEYQALLLRYEAFVRAGAVGVAEELKPEMARIQDELKKDLTVGKGLPCLVNAFPMADLLGASDQTAPVSLRTLWNETKDLSGALSKLHPKDFANPAAFRVALGKSLLAQTLDGPGEFLPRAHKILQEEDKGNNLRPVEAHFLAMLDLHLPRGATRPGPDLIKHALRVRELAEVVALATSLAKAPRDKEKAGLPEYPYSERVIAWTAPLVETADAWRRAGEDLLFGTDPERWKEADKYLNAAKAKYEDAQKIATQIRSALNVRDQAFMELPTFAGWFVAQDKGSPDSSFQPLWEQAHQLEQWLSAPPAEPTALFDRLKKLQTAARQLREDLDKLPAELGVGRDGQSQELRDSARRMVMRLTMPCRPGFDVVARKNLLENYFRTITALTSEQNKKIEQASGSAGLLASLRTLDKNHETETTNQEARREAAWTLAVLGKPYLDLLSSESKQPAPRLEGDPLAQVDALSSACRAVGSMINEKAAEALEKGKWDDAVRQLAISERLCRLIDGTLVPGLTRNAVLDSRRLHLARLFRWQADRTLQDHWWSEEQAATPYYRDAGLAYTSSARELLRGFRGTERPSKEREKPLDEIEERLKQPPALALIGPTQRVVTSERDFAIEYQLKAPSLPAQPTRDAGGPPGGFPVLWVERDNSVEFRSGPGMDPLQKRQQFYRLGDASQSPQFDVLVHNPEELKLPSDFTTVSRQPKHTRGSVTLSAFYRGYIAECKTALILSLVPETVVYQHPLPPKGDVGIAVLPDKDWVPQPAQVVIILDCSGSMVQNFVDAKKKITRFMEAKKALARLLDQLPAGTDLSLWVFGQKDLKGRKETKTVEETVQVLDRIARWKAGDADGLMKLVNTLEPDTSTPLLRAMWQASFDFSPNANDNKTMVVLSDGEDEWYASDNGQEYIDPSGVAHKWPGVTKGQIDPTDREKCTKAIRQFLRDQFGNSDIAINFLLFQAGQGQNVNAAQLANQATLEVVRQQLGVIREPGFATQGELYLNLLTQEDLFNSLLDAMGLRYSYKLYRNGSPVLARDSSAEHERLAINDLTSPNPLWFRVGTGPYTVRSNIGARAAAARRRGEAEIRLEDPFDTLLLKITNGGFQRALFADLHRLPSEYRVEHDSWVVALPRNRLNTPDSSQDLLITAEASVAPGDVPEQITPSKPREFWLEFSAPNQTAGLPGVWWGNRVGYPAAAWEVRAKRPSVSPVVHAWVSDAPAPVEKVDLKGQASSLHAEPTVHGNRLKVDVTVEDHSVVNAIGDPERKPCIVVRIEYDSEDPVIARVAPTFDSRQGGFEHQFFKGNEKSGFYTGVFWFRESLSRDEVRNRLKNLWLVSLKDLKSKAHHFELRAGPVIDQAPSLLDTLKTRSAQAAR